MGGKGVLEHCLWVMLKPSEKLGRRSDMRSVLGLIRDYTPNQIVVFSDNSIIYEGTSNSLLHGKSREMVEAYNNVVECYVTNYSYSNKSDTLYIFG